MSAPAQPTGFRAGLAIMALAFALSQSFRTLPSVMVADLSADLGIGASDVGLLAAVFHISFAVLQLPIGVLLDRFGVREVMLAAYTLAIAGTVISVLAPSFPVLLAGQLLIGTGTAPTLMAALVYISHRTQPAQFARYSGILMSVGSLGILATSTPFALLIEASSWRMAFLAHLPPLVLCLALTLPLIGRATPRPARASDSLWQDFRLLARLPYRRLAGLFAIGLVAYGAILAFRGVWIVPFVQQRYGLGLVGASYLALMLSVAMAVTPALTGGLATTQRAITRLIVIASVILALALAALAFQPVDGLAAGIVLILAVGLVSASPIVQFAYIRRAVPAELTGRALALLNMVMFVGVALLQWLSGSLAGIASDAGGDPFRPAVGVLALAVVLGLAAFVALPKARDAA